MTIPSDRAWESTGGTATPPKPQVSLPGIPDRAWAVTLGLVPTILNQNVSDGISLTHNAFPVTTRLADGSIMVLYRSATKHSNFDGYPGAVYRAFSRDNGRTWSAPTEMIGPNPEAEFTTDGQGGVGGVSVPRSGPLAGRPIVTFIERVYDGSQLATGARVYVSVATDASGTRWGPREELLFDPGNPTAYYPSGQPVQLDDETFLVTGYGGPGKSGWSSVGVILSRTGNTWQVQGRTVLARGSAQDMFSETFATKRSDGRILALVRTDRWQGSTLAGLNLRSTVSEDDGRTWTSERATDPDPNDPSVSIPSDRPIGTFAFFGQGHPHLLQTTDGRIYASYRRWATYPAVAADGSPVTRLESRDAVYRVSTDGGATWGPEEFVGAAGIQSTYTAPIEYEPNRVVMIWGREDYTNRHRDIKDISSIVVTWLS